VTENIYGFFLKILIPKKEPLDDFEKYVMHDPAMKCDSKSCRIEAEENWANLQESEKQQKTIEYRASDWPDACGGLSLDDCDLTTSCAKGKFHPIL